MFGPRSVELRPCASGERANLFSARLHDEHVLEVVEDDPPLE
jgi:hypothetical protein